MKIFSRKWSQRLLTIGVESKLLLNDLRINLNNLFKETLNWTEKNEKYIIEYIITENLNSISILNSKILKYTSSQLLPNYCRLCWANLIFYHKEIVIIAPKNRWFSFIDKTNNYYVL
jgi:hypothetical protein